MDRLLSPLERFELIWQLALRRVADSGLEGAPGLASLVFKQIQVGPDPSWLPEGYIGPGTYVGESTMKVHRGMRTLTFRAEYLVSLLRDENKGIKGEGCPRVFPPEQNRLSPFNVLALDLALSGLAHLYVWQLFRYTGTGEPFERACAEIGCTTGQGPPRKRYRQALGLQEGGGGVMPQEDAVPIRDIPDGAHFHDPENLVEGSVRYKTGAGLVSVRIRRYRPGPEGISQENTVVSPGWMVVPGDMPKEAKKAAQKVLAEHTEVEMGKLAQLAVKLRREGMAYDQIAGECGVDEPTVRGWVQDGVKQSVKENSMATKTGAKKGKGKAAAAGSGKKTATGAAGKKEKKEKKPAASKGKAKAAAAGGGPGSAREKNIKAHAMRKKGMTFREIANELGYSRASSARAAARRGEKLASEEK